VDCGPSRSADKPPFGTPAKALTPKSEAHISGVDRRDYQRPGSADDRTSRGRGVRFAS